MDNQRLFLIIALGIVLYLIADAWMAEQAAKNPPPETAPISSTTTGDTPGAPAGVPAPGVPTADTPAAPAPGVDDVPSVAAPTNTSSGAAATTTSDAPRIKVITDEFNAEIDPLGGTITHIGLINYPESLERQDAPFVLLDDRAGKYFIAQSGLGFGEDSKTSDKTFTAPQAEYLMEPGQDSLQVPLTWTDGNGITVTKTFTFHRGQFSIDVTQQLQNDTAEDQSIYAFYQLQRTPPAEQPSMLGGIYTYTGGVISTPETVYEKVDFDDMQDTNLRMENISSGWIAMIQHYFLGAWVPDEGTVNTFYSLAPGSNRYVLGMHGQWQAVPAGSSGEEHSVIYIGPKIQDVLAELAPNLQRTVDYGFLWFIAEPLFWLLKTIHEYVGNWGWSIILLTILIKLAFYKLSETSYRSMANMRKLAPQMQKLKDRYGDDRQKMNQAMMEMYKKEKINPLGGCLPILIQIPVFIALYWTLLESVELRQAPWLGWIEDLSIKDPYYVLPLIMGASMFIQQKLNPTPPDPIQAKVMMALPIVFTFFFLWFPSGLVLYWVVNNVLSIAQQYVITKRVEAGADTKK